MVPLFPSVLTGYVLKTLQRVMECCANPVSTSESRVQQMRTLMLVVERGRFCLSGLDPACTIAIAHNHSLDQ